MKISLSILAICFSLFVFSSCEKNDDKPADNPKVIELTPKAGEIIVTSNNFGVELFTLVAKDEPKNFMLSPLSASVALTMALNGADGETYSQMKEMLGYSSGMSREDINETYKSLVVQLLNADSKVNIAIANALFYRLGFNVKEPFVNILKNDYNTQVKGLDFNLPSALTTINKWAADNTNQRIPKVLSELSPDAVLILMNALYFKGDWSYQFDKSLTRQLPFHLDNGNTIEVETMQGDVGAVFGAAPGYSYIEMPYGRKNFSMVVIVPETPVSEFYNSFTPSAWQTITAQLDSSTEWGEIKVMMPKFTFEYEKNLNEPLITMGMNDAFIPNVADFSQISDQDIFISFVKQNTFVDVNEEGTEAAAVTTIGFETTSVGPNPPTFTVDRPFIFAIRERTTNTLLFIGSVVDPR